MSNNIVLPTSQPERAEEPLHQRPRGIGLALIAVSLIAAAALWPGRAEEGPSEPLPIPAPFAPPVGEWVETSFPQSDGSFTDVARLDTRLVATGTGLRVDSAPFVYWSDDGESWGAADGPWERGDLILELVAHDDGFIAAGHGLDLETLRGNGLKLWTSSHGVEWEHVEPVGLGESPVVTDLAHTGDRFVAVGYEGEAGADPGFRSYGGGDGRVWESSDGISWADITPEGVEPWFGTLAVAGNGDVLVGGLSMQQPTVWRLGLGWSASSNTRGEYRNQAVHAIVTDDDTLIVMSSTPVPESLVWLWAVDADGTWRALFGESRRPQSTGWMRSIDGNLFAGAPFSRAVFTTGPELWVSDRGRDWYGVEVTRGVSPWPPAAVSTLTETGGRLLAFGSRGGTPTIWALRSD